MARPATDSTRINLFVPNQDLEWYKSRADKESEPYSAVVRRAMRFYRLAIEKKEAQRK